MDKYNRIYHNQKSINAYKIGSKCESGYGSNTKKQEIYIQPKIIGNISERKCKYNLKRARKMINRDLDYLQEKMNRMYFNRKEIAIDTK